MKLHLAQAPADSRERVASILPLTAALACCLLGAAVLSLPAHAQEWPTKLVKIVIPFAAGSAGDTWGRVLAPRLEQVWKQPVIIENRPGASGLIGAEAVVNAPPDGYTLLQVSQSFMFAKYTVKALRFDPETALVPVYKFVNYKMVYATNAQTKAKSLTDIVEQSKAGSGVFFGGIGATASHNVINNIIGKQLGIRYATVDYPGPTQVTLSLLRNDVQFAMYTPSAYKQHFEAGTLLPIAVISDERFSELPQVPTVRELGYKGYLPQIWSGLFAPKGTPMPILDKIARDIEMLISNPEFKQELEAKAGGMLLRSSPAAFAREQQIEFKLWSDYFTAAGIKLE